MNLKKIFFILSLLSILLLLFLTQLNQEPIIQGKIKSIQYGNNKISVYLENSTTEIIIFTNKILDLKQQQEIKVWGKQETYKNKEQVVADKINI